MNMLCKPWEVLPKEIKRGRILVGGRDGMDADCAAAQSIVATGTAANGDAPNRASTESEPTNGGSAHCNKNADGTSPERKKSNREAAKSEEATRQSSKREPAGGNVA
jgi:hypothetical protein